VSANEGIEAEVRLYDRLFTEPSPGAAGKDFLDCINPRSLLTLTRAILEPSLADAEPGQQFQFEREGYFVKDGMASTPQRPVFNRVVTLRDSWSKTEVKKGA
jgi:glutaminyl-tRNA synthetase